jgi:hypothetical protein
VAKSPPSLSNDLRFIGYPPGLLIQQKNTNAISTSNSPVQVRVKARPKIVPRTLYQTNWMGNEFDGLGITRSMNTPEEIRRAGNQAGYEYAGGNRTGARRSPQRTPDFLSSLLALVNFMRLSLMKAAHAGVGGAPCRKSGYVGRKRRAKALNRFLLYRPALHRLASSARSSLWYPHESRPKKTLGPLRLIPSAVPMVCGQV